MFKAFKDKLKNAVKAFSKDVEKEEVLEEETIEEVQEEPEEPDDIEKPEPKKDKKEEKEPAKPEKKKAEKEEAEPAGEAKAPEEEPEPEKEVRQEKKGAFARLKEKVATIQISGEKFDDIFWPLELALLENNVAIEVVEKIKQDLKEDFSNKRVGRGKLEDSIQESLERSIRSLFVKRDIDIMDMVSKGDKPYVIAFIGINGSGKTTSMAKIAKMLQDNGLKVVFAAADTFRAASMEQLGEHADNLGIKMIKHDYKSDPAAVAYDAVSHAKSKGIDVVLIDTAGRLHSNNNLMQELKKLIKVNDPDMKIFVGESITGNDCVEQAKQFDEAIGIDGIILTKVDVDEKGGAAISISHVTGKPILYLGTGQEYDDIEEFDAEKIMEDLF